MPYCAHSTNSAATQWRSQPKIGGGEMFDFRRTTVFCLEYRMLKYILTRYTKKLGVHGPLGPPWLRLCCHLQYEALRKSNKYFLSQISRHLAVLETKYVLRLLFLYQSKDLTVRPTSSLSIPRDTTDRLSHPATASRGQSLTTMQPLPSGTSRERGTGGTHDELEELEARELYEWSRDLNFDDINAGIFPSSPPDHQPSTRSVTFSSQLTKRIYAT